MAPRRPLLGDGWPLVGRDAQLRAVVGAAGAVGGVVLSGAAVVGKTRLDREAAQRFAADGRAVEWVTATRATAVIPFGAVSHLLPDDGVPGGNRLAALRSVARRFTSRPDAVVVVDDGHLLDDASAAVVLHLVAHGLAFVVLALRDGEPCPDALTSLWKEGLTERIELPLLSPAAVDELLDRAFDGALDPVSHRRLRRVSAGNPLLLRETLRSGVDSGSLRHRRGVWRWAGVAKPTTRLVEVITDRLRMVDESAREVLEAVACGEPLPLALLESVVSRRSVARAERDGLVVTERVGARLVCRLGHPLYGEVLRRTTSPARIRDIAGGLADAVTRTPMRRRDDALRAGLWYLQAGSPGNPEVMVTAAEQAMDRFDLPTAERLARTAVEHGGWRAEHVLAEILNHSGRYDESEAAMPLAPEDVSARVRWAITRADVLFWGEGDAAGAERVLVEAEHCVAEASRSWILLFDARCEEALRVGAAVLRRPDVDPRSTAWAGTAAGAAAGLLGRHDRAEAIHRHALAVAEAHEQRFPWGPVQVDFGYCLGLLAGGRVVEVASIAEDRYAAAVAADMTTLVGAWAGMRGAAAKARGDVALGAAALRESLALLAGYDTFRLAAPSLAELASAHALNGEPRLASRLLDRADRRVTRLFLPWIALDRAWVLAAGGDARSAADTARKAAHTAADHHLPTMEAMALYDAARLGDAAGVRDRLAALAETMGDGLVHAFAAAAAGLADDDPEQLDQAGLVFAAHGLAVHAAEAATVASRLYRSAGLRSRANATAERTTSTARTPLLDRTTTSTLTRRERDVARLAAEGRSSRWIAEHLALSRRTVDNYLGRAYAKLGVSRRSELAAVLGVRN
ncbi:MAG TPA: LuxR C-terminal-related transcriptional regulator [Umezawaea sp.]|nr:LuxR C-terminal-related transcriptional regulator [Umezawaea sp.]